MAIDQYLIVFVFLIVFALITVWVKKLTVGGALLAVVIGFLVFAGGRIQGLEMLIAFFILGTLATSWRKAEKLKFKPAADRAVKRDAWQVLANGGVAAFLGLLSILQRGNHDYLFGSMIAAALASATADTLSSELGMVYGRRFFNILTFKKDQKGLDGVISIEGLLIGIIGSAIIAGICFNWQISKPVFWSIIICGTIGNITDSVLGATLERKGILGNNLVNFLNTLIAALTMFAWLML